MRSFRLWCVFICLLATSLLAASIARAQDGASVQGSVTDSTGGVIVGAVVELIDSKGQRAQVVTNERGEYRFADMPQGPYLLTAAFPGFATARREVAVKRSGPTRVDLTLEVVLDEQVHVSETLSLHDSALSRTLTRQELALLPNDSRLFLQRLREMAGSRGRRGDVAIFVDGFREGLRLPPKETIDMVRISAHPFSAEFHEPGHARIEITTRPGAEDVKADFTASYNADELNARDFFAPTKPDSDLRHFTGYLSGPVLRQKLGFTAFAGRWQERSTDVFNATILDDEGNPLATSGAVTAPTRIDSVLAGLNSMAGKKHSVRLLYGYDRRREDNQGLDTAFDLPERAFSRNTRDVSARGSLLSILTPTLLSETHVELSRRELGEHAISQLPATLVLDAFNAGGNQEALSLDSRTDSAQARQTLTAMFGTNMLKAGVQAEYADSRAIDRGGFGGTFLFGSDVERDSTGLPLQDENGDPIAISPLERYRRTLLGIPGYGASQFSIVTGNPDLSYNQWWLSWFAQNDWKVRPNLTLSLGVRQEWQTYISRDGEFAARLGLGWTPDGRGLNTFRGGAGIFYERLGTDLTLDTTRYDGNHQREFILNQPVGYPQLPSIDEGSDPAIHVKSPDLEAPRAVIATASYERRLPGNLTTTLEYTYERGEGLLLRRNVNVPAADGLLPMPGRGPVLEYASLGESRSHDLLASFRLDIRKTATIMGGYHRTWSEATTDGFRTAPADPNALFDEWGMPLADREHQGHLGATFYLPWDVYFSPYVTASTGRPFNITTGRDANRDTLYYERPGFASPDDSDAIVTSLGSFTLNPAPGDAIVPRNYGRGEPEVRMDLHVSKIAKLPGNIRVTFAADVTNVLNDPVYTGYNSVITSPLFGEPNRALQARRVLLTARVSY